MALAAVILPLLLAALLQWPALRPLVLRIAPLAPLPGLACAVAASPAVLEAPLVLLGLRLGLDATGRTFLLFTAILWLVAGLAARAYHANDGRQRSLWTCWLLALAGNVWLVLARDAAGFYAGFALMTFAGYGLVVHAQSDAAWRAGRAYIVLAVLGEAALLAGMLLLLAGGASSALPLALPVNDTAALALLFAGFGVKAGIAGLHFWLPLAHPVAPTPASAVLSGAMIKAGVLGWMRFLPLGEAALPVFGAVVIGLGLVAMFGAVVIGLAQRAPKTVLAYSSISQVGFLTVGVGAGLAVPSAWPALAVAVAGYALHHALAKGALFLGAATVPADAAGRRRHRLLLCVPALALAGAPLTSGLLAKYALKSALPPLPGAWPWLLDWLLPLAAAGTALLMARFLWTLAQDAPDARDGLAAPWLASVALSAAAPWLGQRELVAALLEPTAAMLALAPLLPAVAFAAWVMPRWQRRAEPAIPAGDLLVWIGPAVSTVWAIVTRTAAWFDRPRRTDRVGTARFAVQALLAAEASLLRSPVAGVVLLMTLLVLLGLAVSG
jgi:hydrogenase-4 component B